MLVEGSDERAVLGDEPAGGRACLESSAHLAVWGSGPPSSALVSWRAFRVWTRHRLEPGGRPRARGSTPLLSSRDHGRRAGRGPGLFRKQCALEGVGVGTSAFRKEQTWKLNRQWCRARLLPGACPRGMVFDSSCFRYPITPLELVASHLPCKWARIGSNPIGGSSLSRGSFNGRTGAFEALDRGSSPRPRARQGTAYLPKATWERPEVLTT